MSVRFDVTPPAAPVERSSSTPVGARLPPAPRPRVLDSALTWIIGGYAALVVLVWSTLGGVADLTSGATGAATSLTRLTGLAASSVGLAGLVLAARPRLIERTYGLDRMLVWHRILGETMAVLIGVHVVTGVWEWQVDGQWGAAIADMTGRQPYMAGAFVGALLVGIVTVSSLRSVRRHLSYETWYLVHLTAYLALALSFGHQIVDGTDLADQRFVRWAWVGLHLAVALALVVGRWGRVVRSVLFPVRVAEVQRISPDVSTVRLSGKHLRRTAASPGQFFFLRPLTGGAWWRCNPFSLSAAPTTGGLRFSIKDRGDSSSFLTALPVGTKVAIDGPYGACTPAVTHGRKVIFVVGGVGVAPVRAMLEDLPAGSEPIVLYRASRHDDLVHHDEIEHLVQARGGRLLTLVGPTATLAVRDPFAAETLRRAVPDVAERVAVLCGPTRLIEAASRGLRQAGVARDDIHFEHQWW